MLIKAVDYCVNQKRAGRWLLWCFMVRCHFGKQKFCDQLISVVYRGSLSTDTPLLLQLVSCCETRKVCVL